MAVGDLPEEVQKLWFGKVTYSKSFLRDFWLVVKNKHILLSCAFTHPLHPYSKTERILVLLCTLLCGFGVALITAPGGGPAAFPTYLPSSIGKVRVCRSDTRLRPDQTRATAGGEHFTC